MRKAAIFTTGRQLNDGEMYIFSLYDLEPAGILVRWPLMLLKIEKHILYIKIDMAHTDSSVLRRKLQRANNVTNRI
jgi:hypothetical protein